MTIDHHAKAAVRPALAVSRLAASALCLLAAGTVLAQTTSRHRAPM